MNTLFIVIHIIGFCEWVDERQESGHMTVSPAKKNWVPWPLHGKGCDLIIQPNQTKLGVYTMPLYCTCSVSQRAIRRGLLPFGGRFLAEIFVQNWKWRVSQRRGDVSYILIQLLLLYLKNLLSYTAWHNYFQAFIAVQILPSYICIMRVYTIPLYCNCSVSQRCKKTSSTSLRRPFCSRNIRPKFKMTGVSEKGRRKLYFDPTFVTVSQKLAELYSLT